MNVKKLGLGLLCMLLVATGCGNQEPQKREQGPVAVNVYKIEATDLTVEQSYTGTIEASQEVALRSRVGGHVIEKYIHGGERVEAGQALFKLDSRQYEANLAAAQAGMAQSNANYQNVKSDLQRYEMLAKEDAIARQVLDTQRAKLEQSQAAYEATVAQARLAAENVQDTVIYAPFGGILGMDDVELGTFVAVGSTPLVTLSATDTVTVEFSLSEAEYLMMTKHHQSVENRSDVELKLSDGSVYEHRGRIVQISKSLSGGVGKLSVKAQFPNPDGVLLPGMYGTVVMAADPVKNAITVPAKALMQILDKNFVLLLSDDGTVKQVPVTVGATQGKYILITQGLAEGDTIVVDGLTKARPGAKVQPTLLTKEQIDKP